MVLNASSDRTGRFHHAVTPPREPERFEPACYRRWFETPLGAQVDADERAVVFALADLERGEHVLDLGCGDGNYTESIADRTGAAVGVDRSPAMLRAARARLGSRVDLAWIRADGAALPFHGASFDAVISVTVLCFAEDPSALLAEAHRVLRRGGRIVVGELGRRSLWAVARRVKGLFAETVYRQAHFFSRSEIAALLTGAGFRDVHLRSAVFYPPIDSLALTRGGRLVERASRRVVPWAGAFLVAVATRP